MTARNWEWRKEGILLNRYRVSVLPNGKSPGVQSHKKVNVFNETELPLKMIKLVNFMLCVFYHTQKTLEPPPEGNHRGVKLIATRQMLPARPAPSPPQQPRGEGCLLCSGLPASVLGNVSAPASYGLSSASLTDPVLQALLQGSTKSQVTLFCRRVGTEFTSSQRDLCNPRVQGSARLLTEGGETHFPDESRRSWELCMFVLRGNRLGVGDGIRSGCSFFCLEFKQYQRLPT